MKRVFIHNPFFRIFAPPVYGIVVYLVILLINNNVEQLGSLFSNQEVYVSIALSLLSFESMRLVLVLLAKRFNLTQKTITLQIFLTTGVSVTLVLLAISQFYSFGIGFNISLRELLVFGIIFTLTSLLYNALYIGNIYLNSENTSQLDHEARLRESLEAEFQSFRQEINPALLYDSLEELILCMHRKTDTAEELIDSLAALYRYQLEHRQHEFITLAEELQAISHWLRLVNQKHENHIVWNNHLPDTGAILLMPGALITALDSVVRNTLISADSKLCLDLETDDDGYFVLRHGLNDRLQLHAESLEAFQRLQRSYSVYSDRPFIQIKAGRENYIKFPQITVTESA